MQTQLRTSIAFTGSRYQVLMRPRLHKMIIPLSHLHPCHKMKLSSNLQKDKKENTWSTLTPNYASNSFRRKLPYILWFYFMFIISHSHVFIMIANLSFRIWSSWMLCFVHNALLTNHFHWYFLSSSHTRIVCKICVIQLSSV